MGRHRNRLEVWLIMAQNTNNYCRNAICSSSTTQYIDTKNALQKGTSRVMWAGLGVSEWTAEQRGRSRRKVRRWTVGDSRASSGAGTSQSWSSSQLLSSAFTSNQFHWDRQTRVQRGEDGGQLITAQQSRVRRRGRRSCHVKITLYNII